MNIKIPLNPIIVTGATSGIGEATTNALLREGCNLAVVGRSYEKLNQKFNCLSKGLHFYVCDISAIENINELIKSIVSDMGPIGGLVHCAGICINETVRFLKEKTLFDTFNVNLFSLYHLLHLIRKKENHCNYTKIITFSSIASSHAQTSLSAYSASKSALEASVKTLSCELSRDSILINSLKLGMLNTPMLDKIFSRMSEEEKNYLIKRHSLGIGNYDSIIPSILFLLSEQSNWLTGSIISLDGGYDAT